MINQHSSHYYTIFTIIRKKTEYQNKTLVIELSIMEMSYFC